MPDVVIAFDHLAQTATLATIDGRGRGRAARAVAARARGAGARRGPDPPGRTRPATGPPHAAGRRSGASRPASRSSSRTSTRARCSRSCPRGASRCPTAPRPLTIYRALRRINPSPYLFARRPRARQLDPGRVAGAAGPGPRREVVDAADSPARGRDPTTRCATPSWRRTCAPTQKELAEHAMLVDLARNDVGRVAEAGSVEWPLLYGVERYSHVMHLVSEVRGRLRDRPRRVRRGPGDVPGRHALAARPKVRAMQAIAEVEQARRGAVRRAPSATSRPTTSRSPSPSGAWCSATAPPSSRRAPASWPIRCPARESAEVAAKAGAVLAALAEAERRDDDGRGHDDDGDARGRGARSAGRRGAHDRYRAAHPAASTTTTRSPTTCTSTC